MRTFINTPFSATYALSSHNEYNVYNYYCDNGLSTGGITYTLLDGAGNVYVQTYLTMTVTNTGITLNLNTQNSAFASAVPYTHSIKQCLTYYPTNCVTKTFTVILDPDCSLIAFNSINPKKLQETFQVGQATVTYPITFQTTFDPSGPQSCVYPHYWQVMVDGVDRTNNLPTWLTVTLSNMAISSSSAADVGIHVIKIYGFLKKVPIFPTNLLT